MMDNIIGFNIAVEPLLTNCKNAIKVGSTLYVSPAMWDLMENSTSAELEHLWANLRYIEFPTFEEMLGQPMMFYDKDGKLR